MKQSVVAQTIVEVIEHDSSASQVDDAVRASRVDSSINNEELED